MENRIENKKGNMRAQVTIFIIVAIILVAAVVGFFIFKDKILSNNIPSNMEPVYNSFVSCLQQDTEVGIDVLESQGGYIELPAYEPGSNYMPFSSQLNFLGNPIPYWYYVSGNNIQKEQVPTKQEMEKELEAFIENKINNCKFDSYYEQGYEINKDVENVKASVTINDNNVIVSLDMPLEIIKGEQSARVTSHKITVNSKLGKLYGDAKKLYNYEQKNMFLENYAIDDLRLYAPVDGVELSCSPLTWEADKVFDDIESAVEANTLALRSKNADYSLSKKENKYFVLDLPITENARFINSKSWPHKIEVDPSKGSVLIAEPVGNQQGLGVLGFCYVPYHFVYNLAYPVLVQVYDGDEIFQFPMAVVIKGNKQREALNSSASEFGLPELCNYKNVDMNVRVYDTQLNPVDADVSYECFGTQCDIGKAQNGVLNEKFPQCVNGYVLASANGYSEGKQIMSSVNSGNVDIILDRLYEKQVNLKLDNANYNGDAIINFVSDKNSKTVLYPSQKKVELTEGQYSVSVYIYKSSQIQFEESSREQCVDVASGISGLLGVTKKKCFDVTIPSQVVSNVLAGGGEQEYYITESELESSRGVEINTQSLPVPSNLEQLQNNYILYEDRGLNIEFK